jgi:hypothetical protein
MASIGTGNQISEIARTWFASRVGSHSEIEKLTELKHIYYTSQLGVEGTLSELERLWLKKYITDNGGTPSDTNSLSTLWAEAVLAAGLPVSKIMTENKRVFYSNVA